MPRLDRLKEEIAYLKLWQGIVLVTNVSLVGWLISAVDTAAHLRLVLGILGVAVLTFNSLLLHYRIDRRIEQIGKLRWKPSSLWSRSPSYS